jgi:hypothetical protein
MGGAAAPPYHAKAADVSTFEQAAVFPSPILITKKFINPG